MGLVIKLILFETIFLFTRVQSFHEFWFDIPDYAEDRSPNDMCPEIEDNVTKQINKTISVLKTKTVFKCCDGYEKVNENNCQAVCSEGCVNGNCTEPNLCRCDAGWEGTNCTKECSPGWFGIQCIFLCDCDNGATCDRFNGTCNCLPGYTGKYCETLCEGGAVGEECANECKCKNGGQCLAADDICDCPPGYYGHFCEEQCEEGTFGKNCSGICTCDKEKTEFCNPINGKCECAPGFKGDICDKPCETGSWGRQCDNKCNCGPNGTCHHILGLCICPPGWYGIHCEDKCPNGFFEQDCKMKCPECPHEQGTCHHETGWCKCPPGVTGPFCHLECPAGKYGANCADFCLCNNNSTCDSITGECSCTHGWIGTDCSMPCPEGTYGVNCSMSCNCSHTDYCDRTSGSCSSMEKLIEEIRRIDEEESLFPPVYVNALLGFFGFIFIAVVLSAVTYELSKKQYFSNFYQNLRTRIQGRHFFKASELKKEDSSTTNVFQEDINPSGQFVNPMYDSTDGIAKSDFRPTSEVHPIYGNAEQNHNTQITDHFEDIEFSIPEPVYSSLGSTSESPAIIISFESDFQRCSVASSPVIKYSNPGNAHFFSQTERNSPECSDNVNVENEKHCYENFTEDGNRKTIKE